MLRIFAQTVSLAALVPFLLAAPPAAAATKAQPKEMLPLVDKPIIQYGVEERSEELAGKKRDDFIKRCMANGNYEPAARKDAMKKGAKKPAKKQNMAAPKPATQKQ